jgi:hypothetical protein
MKNRMMIENPADVELTMKFTMKAKDWEILRDQIYNNLNGKSVSWPLSELTHGIDNAFAKIRKIVYADEMENKE